MDDKKEMVREGYDSIADRYYENRDSLFDEEWFERFLKRLPTDGKVLDLGCGSGVPVTRYMVDRGYDVLGIDISQEMLKRARDNIPEAEFIHDDMMNLPLEGDAFDGLTAFYSIIHLPREQHAELFRKLHKILKAGGVMLISLGSSDWEGTNDDFLGAQMYWSHHSPRKTRDLIRDAGFELLDDYFLEEYWEDMKEKHYWILAENGTSQ